MIAGLVRAATNICEAFIGQWLVVRAGEEVAPLPAECIALRARPVVAVDGVVLVSQDGTESPLDEAAYRVTISRDGSACITVPDPGDAARSEEHTSELQSLMRISSAVFCLKKKKNIA